MTADERGPDRCVWFDVIRGLSAVAVCANHLRAVLMVDYGTLARPTLFDKLFYALTGLGHQAVMVFFVLSGFFVGGSVIKAGKDFGWRRYGLTRLSRLWMVVIPALAFTVIVNVVLGHFSPATLAGESALIWHSGPMPGEFDDSALTLLGNLFFVQTIVVPVFGVNAPLWSLANEFWYYVAFPLLVCAGQGRHTIVRRVLSSAACMGVLVLMPAAMRWGFLVWLMGAGVYRISTIEAVGVRRWLSLLLWPGYAFFATALVLSKAGGYADDALTDVFVGFAVAVLGLGLANRRVPAWMRGSTSWLEKISEISFSLYVAHFPVVLMLGALLSSRAKLQPDWLGVTVFVASLGLLMAWGAAFWWLFERHTVRMRGVLAHRWHVPLLSR